MSNELDVNEETYEEVITDGNGNPLIAMSEYEAEFYRQQRLGKV